MTSTDVSRVSSRRGRALALALLSVFLISGDTVERSGHGRMEVAPAPLPAVSAPGPGVVARQPHGKAYPDAGSGALLAAVEARNADLQLVTRSLALANPSLSPRDLARIGAAVLRYSAQYGLEPDLVVAIMLVESDARPWAHSPKGAVGLMQVMPHMMQPMRLAGNAATIEANIEAGCSILANNIRRLGMEDGISAYFWGSEIRGVGYLEKVLSAREKVRGLRTS